MLLDLLPPRKVLANDVLCNEGQLVEFPHEEDVQKVGVTVLFSRPAHKELG